MTLLGLVILTVLTYTYLGYPVAIGVCARLARRRPPARPDDGNGATPLVSVCLPVHDGAAHLPAKIESLLAQDYPQDRIEILVYCDGCTDDTEATARSLAASLPEGRMRVFADARRLGKPTGLNTLGPAARGDLLLLNDVRQPLSANAVRALAHALEDPSVGCATGNLVLAGGAPSGVYWRYEHWIRTRESRFRGVVGMTGSIAMMRRADLKPLPPDLILDDVWIPMQLVLASKRVASVAEAQAYDTAFEDDREFGRKVRTLAGNYQLFAYMPELLMPFANPLWFETVSHKVLRLVAPWLLLALAAVSGAAALTRGGWLPTALLAIQVAFYAAATVGRRGGRLAGVARTFVVLNTAAVLGLWRFLAGRQRVTW